MNEDAASVLVQSLIAGRYALDLSARALVEGDHIEALIGGRWIPFRVGKSHYTASYPRENGCYVVPGNGEPLIGQYLIDADNNVCGLCVGMRVRYPSER